MNRRRLRAGLTALVLALMASGCEPRQAPDSSLAAWVGSDIAPGFSEAGPQVPVGVPQDLGSHPDYRLEWWYLTANLQGPGGEPFGLQWTLFRLGLQPGGSPGTGWKQDELWLAHAALSRPGAHRFAAKAGRGGTGQAGVTTQPFAAWIDDWQLVASADDSLALQAQADGFGYRLQLKPTQPAVLHGERGFSAKSAAGGGSMYFSYPALAIQGEVELDGQRFAVTGQGWFDREWTSQLLQPDQQGWDWLALHLDDGRHLMLFRVRGAEPFYAATLVQADGRGQSLQPAEFSLVPLEERDSQLGRVPVRWQVAVPAQGIALEVSSWPGEYWNPGRLSYWEGPVTVSGSHQGQGYLEMTGYGD